MKVLPESPVEDLKVEPGHAKQQHCFPGYRGNLLKPALAATVEIKLFPPVFIDSRVSTRRVEQRKHVGSPVADAIRDFAVRPGC